MTALQAQAELKINAPNLDENSNKISAANAEMPGLVFILETDDLNMPSSAKYRWWLRIQYETVDLRMQRVVHTMGCDRPIPLRHVAVWALPGGTLKEVCEPDMSARSIWIETEEPTLNINKPLTIVKSDGTSHVVSIKNKLGEPIEHNGMMLYGGGRLDLAVKVEYKDSRGVDRVYIAHFPDYILRKPSLEKVKGLNPDEAELKKQFQFISNSLYSDDPSLIEKQIRQKISGKKSSPSIPGELYTMLPKVLDAIACRETNRHQFCQKDYCIGVETENGYPIVSWDGGYGMFQLTNPHPTYYQKWSWRGNLVNTVQRIHPHFAHTIKLANSMPTSMERNQVYYRELIARNNASSISYFNGDKRKPIVCREEVAFKNNAPNTDPLYRKNLEDNTALLQALDQFARRMLTTADIECGPGKARTILLNDDGSLDSVSDCRDGEFSLIRYDRTTYSRGIPTYLISQIRHLGYELLNRYSASCNGGRYDKNAGRLVVGTFTAPNVYNISRVGYCRNSSICYVDVDFESDNNVRDACIGEKARRSF